MLEQLMNRLYLLVKHDRGEKLWLNYHVFRNLSLRYGNGSTKAHAAIKSLRCSSIPMESVAHVAAIARTPQRLSARAALLSKRAAIMRSQSKNLTEFGAVFQKMIALRSWLVAESHSFQTHHKFNSLPQKKIPRGQPRGISYFYYYLV
jgi:hypothetical protein